MTWVKICGVSELEAALAAATAGADALGLNFVPTSPRRVDPALARTIARAVREAGHATELIGVVADLPLEAMLDLAREAELDALQLHGDEPAAALERVLAELPRSFKAVRIGDASDVARAAGHAGDRLLVDAKVPGTLGGSGAKVDWELVRPLVRARDVVLAGGLTPSNVRDAIAALQPFGVDVASGVELRPGVKDLGAVAAFVAAARGGAPER